jgi:hypothetical protein
MAMLADMGMGDGEARSKDSKKCCILEEFLSQNPQVYCI